MSKKILSELWNSHQNQIRLLPHQRAFLSIDFPKKSSTSPFDGSTFLQPIRRWMETHAVENFYLLLNRQREESWKKPERVQKYQELICFQATLDSLEGCVWKKNLRSASEIEQHLKTTIEAPLEKLAALQHAAVLHSERPLLLETVCIPKPWGYEEWYTGVEKRGVVKIQGITGSTELPYALSLFRQFYLKHHPESLILMKTLNPVAQEVIGDLYLEMHEKKWEVYVVTKIDPTVWPSGEGIIKAGFNEDRLKFYQGQFGKDWETSFLKDFEQHISAYEKIRRNIDQKIDQMRKEEGIDLNAPLTPELTQKFFAKIPLSQQKEEKKLREELYQFVGDHKVKVGDVVTFPPHQMHCLQHGIGVIEFQTPHYERLIVMFAQKVLTQDHWNTAKALSLVKPESYQSPQLEKLGQTAGWSKERFVDFPDFTADRITIQPRHEYLDQTGEDYHLLIGVTGEGTLHSSALETSLLQPGNGMFLPVALQEYTIRNSSSIPLVYLKATPKF